MKTLVLALGNPILRDDGVGLRVASCLQERLKGQEATVVEASVSGLGLLDLLLGYDRAIIIDAIQTPGGRVGQVYRLDPGVLEATRHAASAHGVNLATALELGRRLGLAVPQQIVIFAIEVAEVLTFGEECTPEVSRAVPVAAAMVWQELKSSDSSVVAEAIPAGN